MLVNNTGVLGRKLLIRILFFSFFITLVTSAMVIYADYREQIQAQNQAVDQIQNGYIESISLSLWEYDSGQIELQLGGILNFPTVVYARVISDGGLEISKGKRIHSELVRQFTYRLQYESSGAFHSVGVLEVVIDQGEIYAVLYKKAIIIVLTQLLKTLVVSMFILFLVNSLITRHLNDMAKWANGLSILSLDTSLTLHREKSEDELSNVVTAINKLRENLQLGLSDKNKAQAALEVVNSELEERVEKRTSELTSTVDQLSETISELKFTQHKLVEAEKLASLGQMVAGVAHELNTPLGIGITTQSHLNKTLSQLLSAIEGDPQNAETIEKSAKELKDGLKILEDSLFRASDLVGNFKKLAIDRSTQISTQFSLVELMERVENAMAIELSGRHCDIKVLYVEDIEIINYPEPLFSVISQLIQNSLQHGFTNQPGTIVVSLINSNYTVTIDYRDDGVGITEDIRTKIFDPFVTTGRGKGRTGLGMHLVYNLVTQILDGTISCLKSENGAHFSIELPKKIYTPMQ